MKIISTLNDSRHTIRDLDTFLKNGTDIVRLNSSFCNLTITSQMIKYVRESYPDTEYMFELESSKIRVSELIKESCVIKENNKVLLCVEKDYEFFKTAFKKEVILPISSNYKLDFEQSKIGDIIKAKDNKIQLKVINVKNNIIECIALTKCIIYSKISLNIPNINRNDLLLNEKDINSLKWSFENEIDIICLSYATLTNVKRLKERILELEKEKKITIKKPYKIFAKIESIEGIKYLNKILKEVDGILLSRDNLCNEINLFDYPEIETKIIKSTLRNKKEIFVGKYLLESATKTNQPSVSEILQLKKLINMNVTGLMLSSELIQTNQPEKIICLLKEIINIYKI